MPRIAFDYPYGGLSEVFSFSNQEVGTSRDERNMRSIDPVTQRIRGAQRAGLGLHAGGNQLDGSNKIKAIVSLAKDKTQLTWAKNQAGGVTGSNDWDVSVLPTPTPCVDIIRDDYGGFYAADVNGAVHRINSDGEVINTMTFPLPNGSKVNAIAVDQYQNIIAATGPTARDQTHAAVLYAAELQADGTYALAWQIEMSSVWSITSVAIYPGAVRDTLYVTSSAQPSTTAQTNVYMHVFPEYDMTYAPKEDVSKKWTQAVGQTAATLSSGCARLMQVAIATPGHAYVSVTDQDGNDAVYQAVFRVDPNGTSPASSTYSIINSGGGTDVAGIGMCVTVIETLSSGDIHIATAGDKLGSNSAVRHITVLKDDKDAGTLAASSGVSFGGSSTGWRVNGSDGAAAGVGDSRRIRIAVDKDGHLYVPYGLYDPNSAYTTDPIIFCKYVSNGISDGNSEGIDGTFGTPILAVALPIGKPEYGGVDIPYSEYAVYGGEDASAISIWQTRLAKVTQSTQAPRDVKVVVAGSNMVRVLNAAGTNYDTNPTSYNSHLDSAAPYVQMVPAFGKVYIVDGKSNLVYDPDDGTNGSLKKWTGSGMAETPKRCRLVETWRGRIVLARDPEDPSAWHMSEVFDPDGWDNFPQNPSASDAISARNSRAGGIPDIVNTVIPYNDDLCIFGGDSSIWQLTGDPRAGGQLDLLTDSTGISFGRPWCKDPNGRMWFFGSHGDLYVMAPGQLPASVSASRVPRSLQQVDLGNYYVNLVWNYIDNGVHIFVCPFGAGGALVDHWFYDAANNAFHKDRFGQSSSSNIQPTAAIDLNGDTFSDRAVLIGGEDGRLRRWGKDSSGNMPSDDEQTTSADIAIDSYVTAGPIGPPGQTQQLQITELSALLGDSQDGCNFEVFSSDNPEDLGQAKAAGFLRPGRNGRKLIRVSGDNVFIRMRNARASSRWAYEQGYIQATGAGDLRTDY